MKPFASLVGLLVCMPAMADQFYLTAQMNCYSSKPELKVTFHGSWNSEGVQMEREIGQTEFDPRKLVTFEKPNNDKYVIRTRVESKTCRLRDLNYTVEVSPSMAPGFHPEGLCATRIGAKIVVKLKGSILAAASVDACTETGNVTKSISLSPGQKAIYEEIDAKQFYGM